MLLLEAIIIYLAAGAPFGVLVLFSQKTAPTPIAAFYALLTTLTWPIFGAYRIYRGLFRKRDRQMRPDLDGSHLDVLRRRSREVPTEPGELFDIAGHSNPWVATNCYARARKKVIESHIDRLSNTSTKNGESLTSLKNDEVISPRIATTVSA